MKARSLLLALVLALATASGFAQITVSQPVSGAETTSPVRVVAQNPSATHMKIYVDDVAEFAAETHSIDTQVSTTLGTHRFTVQSWDKYGNLDKYQLTVTVTSVSSAATTSSTTTTYAKTFSNIDHLDLSTCGNCGNTGGSVGTTASYSQSFASSPALDGKSSNFRIDAPYGTYANAYWYKKFYDLGITGTATRVRQRFKMYIPSAYAGKYQAIEFESQHRAAGYIYNLAWQYGLGRKSWRTFDYVNKNWVDSGITMPAFSGGTWHSVIAEFTIDPSNHTRTTTALYVDGVKYTPTMNKTLKAKYVGGTTKYLTTAYQLDSNKTGDAMVAYVDQWHVDIY